MRTLSIYDKPQNNYVRMQLIYVFIENHNFVNSLIIMIKNVDLQVACKQIPVMYPAYDVVYVRFYMLVFSTAVIGSMHVNILGESITSFVHVPFCLSDVTIRM